MNKQHLKEFMGFILLKICISIIGLILIIILYDIISKGAGKISWEFLTSMPKKGMTEGGILPAIVGTVMVTVITAILSVPLGMGCAIYLNEYAKDNKITIESVNLHKPTLDDVFLHYTGKTIREQNGTALDSMRMRRRAMRR